MEPTKDLAIVLRWVPYQERHRVVTALTENHGRISALARNSIQSRRFGGTLEPFAASEWCFTERPGAELYQLESAEIRKSYEGIQADFQKLTLASTMNEVMLRVAPERESCTELFKLHANALAAVEETSAQVSLLNSYLIKILKWSGNQPQLESCLSCGNPLEALPLQKKLYGKIEDAGWTCCGGSALQFSRQAMSDLQTGTRHSIRNVTSAMLASAAEHQAMFTFIEALMVYHLPGFDRTPLKSARFLNLEPMQLHPSNDLRQRPSDPV